MASWTSARVEYWVPSGTWSFHRLVRPASGDRSVRASILRSSSVVSSRMHMSAIAIPGVFSGVTQSDVGPAHAAPPGTRHRAAARQAAVHCAMERRGGNGPGIGRILADDNLSAPYNKRSPPCHQGRAAPRRQRSGAQEPCQMQSSQDESDMSCTPFQGKPSYQKTGHAAWCLGERLRALSLRPGRAGLRPLAQPPVLLM